MNIHAIVGIPPVSFRNPIWYKGYRIYPGDNTLWEFQHDDYDGAEDSGDSRCGFGDGVAECRDQIDEMEDE